MKCYLFWCNLPGKGKENTGAIIGSATTIELLSDSIDIEVINTGHCLSNPHDFGLKKLKYYLFSIIHLFKCWNDLYRKIKSGMYDGFYFLPSSSTLGFIKDLVTIFIVNRKHSPIIAHVRNGNYGEFLNVNKMVSLKSWLISKVSVFIFLSDSLKNKALPIIPKNKLVTVFNPIDKSLEISEDSFQKSLQIKKNREQIKVLYMSNLIFSKGYQTIIEAAILIFNENSKINLEFSLYGGIPDQKIVDHYISKIHKLGLSNKIKIHGPIYERELVKNIYIDSNVFCLPTFYPNEAQPRSIIEAMNCGLAVLSSNHASIPEMVNKDFSVLVNNQDANELKAGLLKLIDNQFDTLSNASRCMYINRFSREQIKIDLLNIFNKDYS
jgi:glycosyltransferase involved in cell wall biosynthesis